MPVKGDGDLGHVTISLPHIADAAIDALVDDGIYESKSDFIRAAVCDLLRREERILSDLKRLGSSLGDKQ